MGVSTRIASGRSLRSCRGLDLLGVGAETMKRRKREAGDSITRS